VPEGHTIHRLAAEHAVWLAGGPVRACSPQGRFTAGAALLDGATLIRTDAHGKHLFHEYRSPSGEPRWLHVHLGLYGKFTAGRTPVPAPVGQVRLRLTTDQHWLDLRGPAACELITEADKDAFHARLGADPLRDDADPDAAGRRILRSNTPIGQLLLDQSVVAGVGVAYRAEVLFRLGIDPHHPGRDLTPQQWQAIWADLQQLMRYGVQHGRIDTVRPEHTPEAMGRPPRVDRHGGEVYVYRRAGAPCLICGTPIAAGTMGARNLYWCPRCQS